MLVYIYQAALYCEECGEAIRERLTAESKAPRNPEDEGSYDSDVFPKGPTEEGESDAPSHCDACHCFLESELTDAGADYVLECAERVLRGEEACGLCLGEWVDHYEGRDSRIKLSALAESGLTIGELLSAMKAKDEEITCLRQPLSDQEYADVKARVEGILSTCLPARRTGVKKALTDTLTRLVAEVVAGRVA